MTPMTAHAAAFSAWLFALLVSAPALAAWTEEAERCYQLENDPPQAIAACTRAIASGELDRRDLVVTYSNRGISYTSLGMHGRAMSDYDKALELAADDPFDAFLFNNKGIGLAHLGDYDQAVGHFQVMIDNGEDLATAHNNMCWALALDRRLDDSLMHCESALALEPDDPIILASRGYTLMLRGELDAALADADRSVERGPDLWETHLYRGFVHEARGDHLSARADYWKAYELAPYEHEVRTKLCALGQLDWRSCKPPET